MAATQSTYQRLTKTLLASLALGVLSTTATSNDRLPNILFILVDDMGWTDLGCYGSDYYESPAIDRLAAESLRFTQAYAAAPVCSPTRASILTGQFPARLDMTIWHEGALGGGPKNREFRQADSEPNLPLEQVTLAELLHDRGYFTAHVGKWHLGTAAYYPETQGYDVNVGGTFWGAPATFFYPFRGAWNARDREMRYVPGLGPGKPNDYLTDRLTDHTLALLEQVHERPFFLSLWFHAVHSPIQAPESAVEPFRRKPAGQRHHDPTYAGMIRQMDTNVARILEQLDRLQLRDHTIVIFTSDNGGVDIPVRWTTPTSNHPLRAGKGTLYEGGLRVPLIVRWPHRTQPGTVSHAPVSSQDFFSTFHDALQLPDVDGQPQDGRSLLPLLENPQAHLDRETLYWHFPHYYDRMTPGSAIRHGDWKLIHYYEGDRQELYRLDTDLGETDDLAAAHPDVVQDLRRRLDEWRTEVGANAPTARSPEVQRN